MQQLTGSAQKKGSVFRSLTRGTKSIFTSSSGSHKHREEISPSTYSPTGNTFNQGHADPYIKPLKRSNTTATEDELALLAKYDTVFLIDDSSSMAWTSGKSPLIHWDQVEKILHDVVSICTKWDRDGIDVGFFNQMTKFGQDIQQNITDPKVVMDMFREITPSGSTPTGQCLDMVVLPYISDIRERRASTLPDGGKVPLPKPINIIVFTDGAADDSLGVRSKIIQYAKELDVLRVPSDQLGIQFFQVGNLPGVAKFLKSLDDNLSEKEGCRDIVDTRSTEQMGGKELNAMRLLTVVLGAVSKRLDIAHA